MLRFPRMVVASAVVALVSGATPALAKGAKKKAPASSSGGRSAPKEVESQGERDLSTKVDVLRVSNGGLVWSVDRQGPNATVALVVRAGARQEDMDHSGVAVATARWVEMSLPVEQLARSGVTVAVDMQQGAAIYTLRGPASAMPNAVAALLKTAMHPNAKLREASRDRAVLEARRWDVLRSMPDLVGAACWTATSFELPTWGTVDTLQRLRDQTQDQFHSVWYRPRNMTLIAVGPGGAGQFAGALSGAMKGSFSRDVAAPGEPGLPVHQVLRGEPQVTLAGAATFGPQQAGAALLLRARAVELLEAAVEKEQLTAPWTVDIVWTRGAAVVFAAISHAANETPPEEKEQANQLRILEGALAEAAQIPDGELTELRKREGARLSRRFSTPEGAVAVLAPFAACVDDPVDVRRAVMAAPTESIRAGLDRARQEDRRLSIRRLRQEPK